MKLKNYLFSSFIHVLPANETFFFQTKFEKKIKLSRELLYLNYKKHAPYHNPFLTTLTEEKTLYIWFYPTELSGKLIIPESYLMFSFFKEAYPNALLLMEAETPYVIVIKNGLLFNTYVVGENESFIEMELTQHGLNDFKRVGLTEYLGSKAAALESLGIQDLYKWNTVTVEHKDLLPKVVNTVAYPLAFLLFFMMSIELYHVNEMEKRLAKVEENYREAKVKNDDVREKINLASAKEEKWKQFVERELPYADLPSTFLRISKAFKDKGFTFTSFSIVGSRVKIEMQTKEDFIKGLNILNKIEGLENVALKHTSKKRGTVSYEAKIIAQGLLL